MNREIVFGMSLIILIAGCGASGESPNSVEAPTAGTAAANEESAPLRVAANPKIAATAEQIMRWTPAAWKPIELLSICEWEKTSFTTCLAPVPDGMHFLVAGSRVLLWSIDGNEPEHMFLDLTGEEDRDARAMAISPDGKWFAVGDAQGVLHVWNLETRNEIVTKELYGTGIQDVVISPDGSEIATITYDGVISIWEPESLTEKTNFKTDINGLKEIEYMARAVIVAAGETTSSWNSASGAKIEVLSPGRYSTGLARSSDGSNFIFGSDGKLVIWNVDEKRDGEITRGVSGGEQVVFSPDGKFIATNNGRAIQVWNLAERRVVQVIDIVGDAVVGICWLPETNLLVVASDTGCTRIWGTVEQGVAAGLKPLHEKVAMPAIDSKVPATPIQLAEVIDFRTFPTMPESEISVLNQTDVSCVVPVTTEEAKTFYRHFLEKEGWAEVSAPGANPAGSVFEKDGFTIDAHFYEAGEGKTNVMLHLAGNYDLRTAPKFDAAPTESTYESPRSVIYRTKADLLTIETNLLRKFHEAGWTGYSRLKTSHNEQPDARNLSFVRDGATLNVSIGKFPADPTSTTIQYALFLEDGTVPIPSDSGYVEFDGSTEPTLIAITSMTLDEAQKFYDKKFRDEGWLVRGSGQSDDGERAWLRFLRNQSDLAVGFSKQPNGKTLVRIGESTGSLWEGSLPKEKDDEVETVAEGIVASDFPILNETKSAKYGTVEKTIEVRFDGSTLANVAQVYIKALEPLGWKLADRGIRDEDYTFITFEKGNVEIALRARPEEGVAVVSFAGDGLLWNKPLPGGKTLICYERWLRENKQPPGLELLNKYEAEMRMIK